MSSPPHGISTTQPAFILQQSIIHRSPPPPKIWGQKPIATTKVTLCATSFVKRFHSKQKILLKCQSFNKFNQILLELSRIAEELCRVNKIGKLDARPLGKHNVILHSRGFSKLPLLALLAFSYFLNMKMS